MCDDDEGVRKVKTPEFTTLLELEVLVDSGSVAFVVLVFFVVVFSCTPSAPRLTPLYVLGNGFITGISMLDNRLYSSEPYFDSHLH